MTDIDLSELRNIVDLLEGLIQKASDEKAEDLKVCWEQPISYF